MGFWGTMEFIGCNMDSSQKLGLGLGLVAQEIHFFWILHDSVRPTSFYLVGTYHLHSVGLRDHT